MSIELARKRAKKYFQYHNLSLTVKIDELLKHYADVKEAYIPVDGDATYAHELDHLQLP